MIETIFSYITYLLVTAFTPGPNNIMSLYAVSTEGWKKGREVIAGILTGLLTLIIFVIIFCHELSKYIPELVKYLKYIGAAYIVWLAVHIAKSTPSESQGHSITFKSGFFLSISNIKVILYLITLYTAYILPSGAGLFEMFAHGVIIVALSAVSWFTWGTTGAILQKFLKEHYRPFNIVMAIILLWCAVSIIR